MKLTIKSVEAWRYNKDWTYNNLSTCEEVYIKNPTTRNILSALRKRGYLTEESKGRVTVEELPYDHACFEVAARGTGEPLFLLEEESC